MASNRWPARKFLHRQIVIAKLEAALGRRSALIFLALLACNTISFAQTADPYGETASAPAEAVERQGGWQFQPRVLLRETYTDNVTLSRGDAQRSEFITEINPGFSIKNKAARSNVDIDYSLNNYFYLRDRNRNTLNHQLHGLADFEFVEDLLFLDTRTNINQTAVSAFGAIGANSSQNNNNQTFRSYSISPYVRKKFGREATAEARYTFSELSSNGNSSTLSNSTGNAFLLKLDSGPAFNEWGWGGEYRQENIKFERSSDTSYESLTGNLRYRINPRLFATGSFGYDRNDYVTSGEKPEGAFWSLGADWRPLRRTSLTFSAGRRYFGNTYSLTFQHATRRTAWDISYQQNLSTSRSQFALPFGSTTRSRIEAEVRSQNPGASAEELQRQIDAQVNVEIAQGRNPDSADGVNFQTNTAFIEKKWQGSFTMDFPKSELRLNAFDSVRDSSTAQTVSFLNRSGDFALSQIIKQSGVGSTWTYHLSPRNDANVGLNLSRFRLVDIGRTDNLTSLNVGIARKLSLTANGTIGYRFSRRDSNFNANDYDENAFIGTLTVRF
jgi:uncharacterized protein (PEP-CTERM system associated)